MELTLLARAFAVVMLLGLPVLALRTKLTDEQAGEVAAARSAVYLSAVLSTLILVGITWGVARWQNVSAEALGWTAQRPLEGFAWAGSVTVAGLLVVWLLVAAGRRLDLPESRLALALMPRSGPEMLGFLLLSAVAAIAEEYMFRGYMLHVLSDWSASVPVAAVLTTLSFGMAHGYQRFMGILRATALGALLALAVVQTGSLFPAIVAHFWINAAVGLGLWRKFFPDADEVAPRGAG
ncbi:MAG: CPBP family intramembrane glutamic endopeptidase [Gemmatimonadota bacterium]